MKVRAALQTFVSFLSISWASSQAPYPPSGYRPSGRQFALPKNPALQPQNQYGPPPSPLPEAPPNQYLPGYDVRNYDIQQQNNGFQNRQQGQTYLEPEEPINRPQQGQQASQNYPRQNHPQRNYLNQAVQPQNQDKQQNSPGRVYLSPQQHQQTQRREPEQFYSDEDFNSKDDGQMQVKQGFGIADENYLPPTTTEAFLRKPTQRRRYPEPTTKTPEAPESLQPDSAEEENPNVAIATAVANGQYYLLQPDGHLQRVTYKTTQTQEDVKNNAYTAKLVYQNVEPITAPIYSYTAPLLRYN